MGAPEYDVLIVGLGAMGSAAAYHLARRGKKVLGVDQFKPPHELGSSHGRTRIIREAYFEHTLYVPLVRRAYELWAELEQQSGRQLLLQTGGLMIGPPDGALVTGAQRSARDHQLPHETLSAAELRHRFPAFAPDAHLVAVWEPRAGILFPELAIQTHLELATRAGATLHLNEPVVNWESHAGGVRVTTAHGQYQAKKLLLSAGSWMAPLLPNLPLPLTVERQVMCWFDPGQQPELFSSARCPIFIWEHAPGRFFYGFPDLGEGVKAAIHHEGEPTQPDQLNRQAQPDDVERVRQLLARWAPAAAGPLRSAAVCMYTNTPDSHFVLGPHPQYPHVFIASPCSGHGFKFSPVIGELAAALLDGQPSSFDLSLFAPNRFESTAP